MSEASEGEVAPGPPVGGKKPRKPVGAALADVKPPRSSPEKSKQAQHERDMENAEANHARQLAVKAADRKWWVDRAMIYVAATTSLACIAGVFTPGLSDDIKKTLITLLGGILTTGLGITFGRATAAK